MACEEAFKGSVSSHEIRAPLCLSVKLRPRDLAPNLIVVELSSGLSSRSFIIGFRMQNGIERMQIY